MIRDRTREARKRAWQAYSRWRVGARRFGALGKGSAFEQPAVVINPQRVFIGDNTFFHRGAWLSVTEEYHGRSYDPRLVIGDRCLFTRDVWISCVGEITIGDEVMVGDRVLITDTYHMYEDPHTSICRQPMADPKPVNIGDGVLLSVGAVVTGGVTIGPRSYVAANAVVTNDVPANTVMVGNPARPIRQYDHERREWIDLARGS